MPSTLPVLFPVASHGNALSSGTKSHQSVAYGLAATIFDHKTSRTSGGCAVSLVDTSGLRLVSRVVLNHVRRCARSRRSRSRSGNWSRRSTIRTDAAILLLNPFINLAFTSGFCSAYSLATSDLLYPISTSQRVIAPVRTFVPSVNETHPGQSLV